MWAAIESKDINSLETVSSELFKVEKSQGPKGEGRVSVLSHCVLNNFDEGVSLVMKSVSLMSRSGAGGGMAEILRLAYRQKWSLLVEGVKEQGIDAMILPDKEKEIIHWVTWLAVAAGNVEVLDLMDKVRGANAWEVERLSTAVKIEMAFHEESLVKVWKETWAMYKVRRNFDDNPDDAVADKDLIAGVSGFDLPQRRLRKWQEPDLPPFEIVVFGHDNDGVGVWARKHKLDMLQGEKTPFLHYLFRGVQNGGSIFIKSDAFKRLIQTLPEPFDTGVERGWLIKDLMFTAIEGMGFSIAKSVLEVSRDEFKMDLFNDTWPYTKKMARWGETLNHSTLGDSQEMVSHRLASLGHSLVSQISWLEEKTASSNSKTNERSLIEATDLFIFALENGMRMDWKEPGTTYTMLHLAASVNAKGVVDTLVARGANFSARTGKMSRGATPEEVAQKRGFKEIEEVLQRATLVKITNDAFQVLPETPKVPRKIQIL